VIYLKVEGTGNDLFRRDSMLKRGILGGVVGLAAVAAAAGPAVGIRDRVIPEVFRRATERREVMVRAKLDEGKYQYYALMQVSAPIDRARALLTDYRLYAQSIPYVDRVVWDEATQTLEIEGGVFQYRLHSWVKFDDGGRKTGAGSIAYRIVAGHFAGLSGRIAFELAPSKGVLVYFDGEKSGDQWPPAFVIERGAEIVFSFTAERMRKRIESGELDAPLPPAGQLPTPNRKLR